MKTRNRLAFGHARNSSILLGPSFSCLASYVSYSRYNGEGRNTPGAVVGLPTFKSLYHRSSVWLTMCRKDHCAFCHFWCARYCLCCHTSVERRQCHCPTQDSQETEHRLCCMVYLLLRRLVFCPYVNFLNYHIYPTTQAFSLKQD